MYISIKIWIFTWRSKVLFKNHHLKLNLWWNLLVKSKMWNPFASIMHAYLLSYWSHLFNKRHSTTQFILITRIRLSCMEFQWYCLKKKLYISLTTQWQHSVEYLIMYQIVVITTSWINHTVLGIYATWHVKWKCNNIDLSVIEKTKMKGILKTLGL